MKEPLTQVSNTYVMALELVISRGDVDLRCPVTDPPVYK